MHLPRFHVLRPESIEETLDLLSKHGAAAKLYAGGTDLFPRMKYGLTTPDMVISLKKLSSAARVLIDGPNLSLDAATPLVETAGSALVRQQAPLLADAALAVGSYQIRHMGTLGGNLCLETRCMYYNQSHDFQFVEPCFKRCGDLCYHVPRGKRCWAVFAADTVPALICLGARIELRTAENRREVALEQFYTGDPLSPLALLPAEMVTRIVLPLPVRNRGWAFAKFSPRGGMEFGGLSVAVLLELMADGATIAAARIGVGAVAPRPVRALTAESALSGQRVSGDLFHDAAEMVAREVKPLAHHGYSASYLRTCLRVQTRDALILASQRVRGNSVDPRQLRGA